MLRRNFLKTIIAASVAPVVLKQKEPVKVLGRGQTTPIFQIDEYAYQPYKHADIPEQTEEGWALSDETDWNHYAIVNKAGETAYYQNGKKSETS